MIYFIAGYDNREFKYFEIIDKIRQENPNIQESFFDVDIKEEEKFLEKVSFNSIFSSYELIVLKRGEKIKDIDKTLDYIGKLDIENKEIIIDYKKEDTKLGVKLTKKLDELKSQNKLQAHLYLKEDDVDIKKYIKDELKIDEKNTVNLLEMIGNNPFKIKNEIQKIKAFLGEEKFEFNKIQKIISTTKEFKIYEMTSSILENNPKPVLDYLEQTKEYMGILYSLYSELEIMYKISSLIDDGVKLSKNYNTFKTQYEDIKEVFKSNGRLPNPYVVFKKIEKIKFYSNRNLKKLLYNAWEVEKNIKTGKIAMDYGVEVFILQIVNLYKKK